MMQRYTPNRDMIRYDYSLAQRRANVGREATIASPTVSIVLPTFNRGNVLRRAVESVLVLDEEPFELIVIDDGSTDGTEQELRDLRDPRVSLIALQSNSGANVARNVGISAARAPYVAFLDSDDTFLPGRLRLPLELLRSHRHIGIVLSAFTTEKAAKTTVFSMPQRVYSGRDMLRLVARRVLQPTTSGLTVRREILQAVGGFDPTLKRMQDSDLVMRIAQKTMAATIAQPLWHKHWQHDGISSNRETYLLALLDLIARHAIYQGEELESRDYLLARHLLALAKSMRFRQLHHDYNLALEQLTPPPPPLPRLFTKYRSSRRERHQLRRSLLSGESRGGHTGCASPFHCALKAKSPPPDTR
jgi:glycosyltransferase involved in cell wall biosynthesis